MGEHEIRGVVRDVFRVEQAMDDDIDYIDSGLLDSLAFIDLLAVLEDHGIEIQPTEIKFENFRSMEEIRKTIARYGN